ncbi:nuclear pore complex protein Nup58 isoform X2 [Anabrus simplex]|uniref:nuclear pore complex protein Nup58 isoform X2 n=1 Tax=Anabrus simplex TaxID=316456 RepID=UPI0035A274E5
MTSGFTFGQAAAQKAPSLTFGTGTGGLSFGTAQTTQSTGLTFGAPAQTGLFGTPATQATGLTFGTPATQATGLTFGTPATSAPTGFSFGSAATSTPQTGLSFGTPAVSAPQTGLTFGTPAASAPQTGLTFGTPVASTAQTSFATPSFGQSSLNFGTPASTAPSGLTFGTPLATGTPATAAQPTLGGFGTTGLAFGTPTTSAGVAATVATTTTTATTGLSLGTFGSGLATTTTATTGFTGFSGLTTTKPGGLFSTPAVTSSAPLGLNFGGPTTSLATGFTLGGTSGGLFGLSGKTFQTATTTGPVTTTTTTSVGLGGIDPSHSKTGPTGSLTTRTDNKAVKENQIPNEIVQTIDNFKNFVKGQKNLSTEIARGSAKPLHKVQEDTEQLKQLLTSLSNAMQKSFTLAVKLKADTAKCLHNAEMAQRTHDTPPGLQYDNTAPLQYFQELVAGFEHDMQILSQEIENTEKHIKLVIQPVPVTSQELALVLRRLHDSFVALAGRLQSVHNAVEAQKEQYMNLRKYILKDSSDVFEEGLKRSLGPPKHESLAKIAAGPTPFSVLGGQHTFGLMQKSPSGKPPLTSSNPLGK